MQKRNQSMVLGTICMLLLLESCSTLQELRSPHNEKYDTQEYLTTYTESNVFYDPWAMPGRFSLSVYRARLYEYIKTRFDLKKDQIVLLNEQLSFTVPAWWSVYLSYSTLGMANFSQQDYKVVVLRKTVEATK